MKNNISSCYYSTAAFSGVKNMGEYARRKSDKVEVKIGVCEKMYYLTDVTHPIQIWAKI